MKDRTRKGKVKGETEIKKYVFEKEINRGKEEMSKEESSGTENRRKKKNLQ
jgi:hypothetical protein